MNDYSQSYVVIFDRRDGSPNEEYFYNDEKEARDHFQLFNDKYDKDNTELYLSIILQKYDWFNRCSFTIDRIYFDE